MLWLLLLKRPELNLSAVWKCGNSKISTHDEDFVEGVEVGSLIGAQLTPQSVTVEIGSNQSMVVFIPILILLSDCDNDIKDVDECFVW